MNPIHKSTISILSVVLFLCLFSYNCFAQEEVQATIQVEQTSTQEEQASEGEHRERKGPEIVTYNIDDEESYSSSVVTSLLESQKRSIDIMEVEANELTQKLKDGMPKLRTVRLQIDSEFNSINLVNETSLANPVEMSLLARQMRRFFYELNIIYQPFLAMQNDVENRLGQINALETNLATLGTEEANVLLLRLTTIKELYTDLERRLGNQLPRTREVMAKILTSYSVLDKNMPELWLDYYFNNSIELFSVYYLESELYNLLNLHYSIVNTFKSGLPADLYNWLPLLRSAIISALLILLIFLSAKRIHSKLPEEVLNSWKLDKFSAFKTSFPFIIFGALMYMSAWNDAGYYQIIAALSIFCLVYGQIKFAWQLYTLNFEGECQKNSPFMPMLSVFIVSLLLLTFIPLQLMLSLLWFIFLIIFLYLARKNMKTDFSMPNFLLKFFIFILILGILLTLVGYVHLSILLTLATICISIGFHQVSAFMQASKFLQEHLPQNGIPALISGLLVAIFLPIILLIGLISPFVWVFVYPGGEYIVMNFGNFAFDFGHFSFNATQLLSILIVFYLVKSLVSVCCNYIDNTWGHSPNQGAASLATPIKTTIIFGFWGIYALYVLYVVGFSLASLAFVAGGLSVGIGLGLQSIMQNVFSGFSLIFGQNIREGDVVEVANILGIVKKVSLRSTQVRTYDNAIVFVPNSEFLATTFINWTRNGRVVRSTVAIGVAYNSDLDLVKEIAKKVLEEHPKVLNHPEPLLLLMDFGASSIDFEFRFWIRDIDEGLSIRGDVRMELVRAFKEHNIEIPFPQTDVHFRNDLKILSENKE